MPIVSSTLEHELHEEMQHLPPDQQRQVLDFARTLTRPRGVPGRELLPMAGTISGPDLAAMAEAIEDCEQVDAHGW